MSVEPTPTLIPIDRLAPGRRPSGRAVMYQSWRSLLFLHWALPSEIVGALLPPGLELDTFDGKAYVGLVPFTMRGIRPRGLPAVPWLSNFHETNVRTYVHVNGSDPGVWFFSLDAANLIAVALARTLFHLPYHHARMSLTTEACSGTLTYTSQRNLPSTRGSAITSIQCIPQGDSGPAAVNTLDHFLLERYFLYAFAGGDLFRGQVHHTPYLVQTADLLTFEETLFAAEGLRRPETSPIVHFSHGVDVEIFSLRKLSK